MVCQAQGIASVREFVKSVLSYVRLLYQGLDAKACVGNDLGSPEDHIMFFL